MSQGPGQQHRRPVLLANRVPVETVLLLAEKKVEERWKACEEKEL